MGALSIIAFAAGFQRPPGHLAVLHLRSSVAVPVRRLGLELGGGASPLAGVEELWFDSPSWNLDSIIVLVGAHPVAGR